ncbi:MAG: dihydroneopterin aldolase [Candidatus Krumholzibacteriia bacterium]
MRAADRIEIKDLLLRGIVGVNEAERRKRQDILINLVMTADTRPVAAADSLDGGLNYRTVTKEVIALVEGSGFHTVEKLAEEIARLVVTGHAAGSVQVTVEKPGALRFARSVGVTVVRGPEDFA